MDTQTAFNIAVGLVAFFGGWVLNSLSTAWGMVMAFWFGTYQH